MGLYARSDVVSVSIPSTNGGCGSAHSRPVYDGVAVDEWNLEDVCIICAVSLRGDPLWAAMPAEIPETPDERMTREDAEKRGERTLKKAQEKLSVQQGEFNERVIALLERNAPADGGGGLDPAVIAELVQREVAKALAAAQEPRPLPPYFSSGEDLQPDKKENWSQDQLMRLHVRTLGKMCRDQGLDGNGSKTELVARLTATT
jgi:hypothetical protein